MTQTLAGFLHGLRVRGCREAAAVLEYSGSRTDARSDIRDRIAGAVAAGKLDGARAQTLEQWLEAGHEQWLLQDKLACARDPRDWTAVNNGRVRVAHIEPDSDTGWTGVPV